MCSFLIVASGGALGTTLRWLIQKIFIYLSQQFPYFQNLSLGTLCVNLIGGYCIGLLSSLLLHYHANESLKLFVIVGFLGGFTTFSSFSMESLELLRRSQYTLFCLHILLHTFGLIFMASCGLATFQAFKSH
ncbi:fluoride efflux transporter CrcB [Helicobacter sp.]|uniref:fluoride efflux transporter CrcB n=1 Tax=Helicobacter sp. TaxID=218 RepID=UPI0019829F93|nr:fluoride efflux transporter CrcB [Helicobacter sp.]MBD5166010.1 fluoride efflux transporter CrcB [Helicobacter sp.]